ncbi:GNAT family N-acetyltransferase [Kocuria sp. CPCC 205235]|uniref:GNAT family N-acetyltransferase n=1 Tax=Kocuria sp. CPCC 205235 TaxID=3073549 RepID=UPI0034D4067C
MVVAGEWGARHSYSGHIASLLADHDSQSMRLGYIITDPAVRGQGRGRALVEAAVARGFEKTDFPLITLGVYAHNHRALGLYESLEFKPTGASIEGPSQMSMGRCLSPRPVSAGGEQGA